jgi:hypothetical protein
MIESLQTPVGRLAIALGASALLVVLMLLVERDSMALLPILLVPIWLGTFATDRSEQNPRVMRWLLAAGVAALLAGVAVFFLAS